MRLVHKYVILIILQQLNYIESFLKQSDLLTKLLSNELKTYKFSRDNFNYKLILDNKVVLFDFKFLEIIGEIDTKGTVYDFYQQRQNRFISLYALKSLLFISFYLKEEKQNEVLASDPISNQQMCCQSKNEEFSCFIYYTFANDSFNRTVHYLNFNEDKFSIAQFNWKREFNESKSSKFNYKIFAHTNQDSFMLFDDKAPKLGLDLPFLGYFKATKNFDRYLIPNLIQFPVLCSDSGYEADSLKQNLYKNLVDAYSDVNEFGISFYFIFRSIDNLVVCFMDETMVKKVISYDSSDELDCQFNNERVQFNQLCSLKPKYIPRNPILIKLDNQKESFKRIFVQTIVDENKNKTRIIFLLDDLNRLHVYDLLSNLEICYEGVYNLINQKTEDILDISLDKNNDMILIVTKFYLQKIPIKSFCISSSYSACAESKSTCHVGGKVSPVCNENQFKNRKCVKYDSSLRIQSELYLCDRESKEMCLAGNSQNLTTDVKESLILCNENSCLCEYQYCLQKRCNFDSTEKKFCPLAKSSMKLSKYSVVYQLEPFHIIIFSKLITLVIITFILVSFYCCFSSSITQSSKKAIPDLSVNSDLKTI